MLNIFAATEPCGGECSYQCAVVDGAEQCYCPSGFVLSEPNGIQCVGQCSRYYIMYVTIIIMTFRPK